MKIPDIIKALRIFQKYAPEANFKSVASGWPFTYLMVTTLDLKEIIIEPKDTKILNKLGWHLQPHPYQVFATAWIYQT